MNPDGPASQRYDDCRRRSRDNRLPPGYVPPQPTTAWPCENLALLERYREWLLGGGASPRIVHNLYIPMAGNALGLNLRPHAELDIQADLERALQYVKAKRLSAEWIDMCRVALERFRRFMRQQRGHPEVAIRPINRECYCEGLPDWVVDQLERLQHLRQPNWRRARINEQICRFWSGHTRLWHWLFRHYAITCVGDIKRQYIMDYIDHRLVVGCATRGINQDLRYFQAFLRFLQDQGHEVPQALLRLQGLKEPDRLPRFLTDEQVVAVRDDLERQVAQADTPVLERDSLLFRAAFYLLWHGGLRLGEVEELCLQDLDLPGRRLAVRQGKGRRDRIVYLTDTAVAALREYLPVRGAGPTDHVLLYRNAPLHKDIVRSRLQLAGKRVGVDISPHRLRHTYATQLLNAGCPVTSIQRLLGHKSLNSTMIYARVHNRTVADDYYAAMAKVEGALATPGTEAAPVDDHVIPDDERAYLLDLTNRLAEPQLSVQHRLRLVESMRGVLEVRASSWEEPPSMEIASQTRIEVAAVNESW
jgi:site-specific recombinase XerD